jgi:hypothetical protein
MRLAPAGCGAILFSAPAWPTGLEAAECIANPPLRLSGKLHGRTIDASGAFVPNRDLRVLDLRGVAAAEFRTDSKGAFVFDFSSLPTGDYDLVTTTKGWKSSIARIVIAGSTLRL